MLSATVKRKVSKDPKLLNEVNRQFLPAAVKVVKQTADRYVPTDDGYLKGSIQERIEKDRAIVFSNMEYAIYNEYGTSRMGAQPFMRPAINENRKNLVDLWLEKFRRVYGKR
jgi:HK97 gp10 family phage protein